MPVVTSEYRAPLALRNPHLNTLFGAFVPIVGACRWTRTRIDTPDGDFLDLDWIIQGSDRALILCHGLEGSSASKPIRSLAQAAAAAGWDVLAWNYRGCSGEPNRTLRLYHSGAIDDLAHVIEHVVGRGYRTIALTGCSLGANLVLRFLGDEPSMIPAQVRAAAVIAAPSNLHASAERMAAPENRIYMRYFLKSLRSKLAAKQRQFPKEISLTGYKEIRTFYQYDDRYTAPLHGYSGADDYYSQCSADRVLDAIKIPTLILNARDDTFLGMHPIAAAERNSQLTLELAPNGGHVSFGQFSLSRMRWHDQRMLQFLKQALQRSGEAQR